MKPLAQGIAWQMQPVYTPRWRNTSHLLDGDGGDNILIAEDADPRTVHPRNIQAGNIPLNSPALEPWTLSIRCTGHFTASRSLGAGEVCYTTQLAAKASN